MYLFLYIYAKLVKACSVSQMIKFHSLCCTLLDAFHELCTMFFISLFNNTVAHRMFGNYAWYSFDTWHLFSWTITCILPIVLCLIPIVLFCRVLKQDVTEFTSLNNPDVSVLFVWYRPCMSSLWTWFFKNKLKVLIVHDMTILKYHKNTVVIVLTYRTFPSLWVFNIFPTCNVVDFAFKLIVTTSSVAGG